MSQSDQPASAFSLEFLQAVSDWQRGGDTDQKRRRGEALKRLASSVAQHFRQSGLVAYRQLALAKGGVWQLLADQHLPETISAWTLTPDIAKAFKGGVPPEGWQGVILVAAPSPSNVVLNLDRLYRERSFCEALVANQSLIDGFGSGAGRYGGTQCEVVMEVESVDSAGIHAMGGYSSDRDTLIRMIFGQEPTPELVEWFEVNREKAGVVLGPFWLEGEALQRVLKRMEPHVERLRAIRSAQLVASGAQ